MQDYQNFTPNNPTNTHQLIMSVIFYAFLIILTFFSFSTIYVLLKNGRSRALSFFVSILYLIFYLSLAGQGINLLSQVH